MDTLRRMIDLPPRENKARPKDRRIDNPNYLRDQRQKPTQDTQQRNEAQTPHYRDTEVSAYIDTSNQGGSAPAQASPSAYHSTTYVVSNSNKNYSSSTWVTTSNHAFRADDTLRRTQEGILWRDSTPRLQGDSDLHMNDISSYSGELTNNTALHRIPPKAVASADIQDRNREPTGRPGPPLLRESSTSDMNSALIQCIEHHFPDFLQNGEYQNASRSRSDVRLSQSLVDDIERIFRQKLEPVLAQQSKLKNALDLSQTNYLDIDERLKTIRRDKKKLKDDMKAAQETHASEIKQLKADQETKDKKHSEIKRKALEELETKHAESLADAAEAHDLRISQLETKIAGLNQTLLETEERVRAECDKEIDDLKKEAQGLSSALVAQEKKYLAPNMNIEINRFDDGDAKARFVELVQMVDSLAMLQWKSDQAVWTEELMERIGIDTKKQSLMQKRILQDIIWTHLHQRIFCSPFRTIGDEGHVLETEWNQACGMSTDPRLKTETFTWPEPDIETERWRYVTITECRAALKHESSRYDPRGIVKRDIIENSKALTSELISSLREIAVWSDANSKSVMQLTRKATSVWLDYAVQRYRVLISIKGARLLSAAEKARRFEEGSLELVVVPELGRYGNAKGYELAKYATIAGRRAEMYSRPSPLSS